MKHIRVIPRLDVKGPNVVKGIHLEGLRIIGKPGELALKYYEQGADELLYIDTVASLYGRNSLLHMVQEAAEHIFIPLTVGGGIRSLEDINLLLRAGADKVAINTAATKNPKLITEAAKRFGSQCIVVQIEAKYRGDGRWENYTENGRCPTGLDVVEWAKRVADLGAGEILLTSIDREGTQKGYELELIRKIAPLVSIPVIASGGAGSPADVAACVKEGKADAVAVAAILHYNQATLNSIKIALANAGCNVRRHYGN